MEKNKQWFCITNVSRQDLIQAGFDGDSVDDVIMEKLADKMSEDYIEQLFWIHLSVFAKELGIPETQHNNE